MGITVATILLSIKPEYANRILTGEKKFEYRKRLSQEPVDRIIVYSTDPIKKVIGEVSVVGTITKSPTRLWEDTKMESGITRSKYRLYFRGCKQAHAYQLGDVRIYTPPKELAEFGVVQAPQSFVYISEE